MFLNSQLSWYVSIPASNLDSEGSQLQRAILIRLMDDFATKKASRDIGYFLAITTLDKIGQGSVCIQTGNVTFYVDFTCISFKIFTGEVLDGVVYKVMTHGVFLKCGPADKVYLSLLQMPEGYEYVPGEAPFFKKDGSDIRKGTRVRFSVIDEVFDEALKEFRVVVGIDSDGLGPMS